MRSGWLHDGPGRRVDAVHHQMDDLTLLWCQGEVDTQRIQQLRRPRARSDHDRVGLDDRTVVERDARDPTVDETQLRRRRPRAQPTPDRGSDQRVAYLPAVDPTAAAD